MTRTIRAVSFVSLLAACGELAHKYNVFAPTSEGESTGFRPLCQMTKEQLQKVETNAFANKPTTGSIKSFFFPDTEVYIKFSRQGRQVKQEELGVFESQIILGAKPCDIKSIELIDKVFLAEPVDTLYREKREKTIIIATPCSKAGRNCSCQEFGISPAETASDLFMTQGGQKEVFLTARSGKGEQLVEELLATDGFTEVDPLPLPEVEPGTRQLSPQQVRSQMEALFSSPLWEKLAMTCLGCGTCTYYCPTCHCYDIRDFNRRDQGVRYRTWDSCMFANFTNMAGNHNPRPTRKDRLQNRFFHKLSYFVKTQGELACVGCGRCAELCPVGISISTVLQEIGGEIHVP